METDIMAVSPSQSSKCLRSIWRQAVALVVFKFIRVNSNVTFCFVLVIETNVSGEIMTETTAPKPQMSRKRGVVGPYSYDDDEDYVPSKGVKYSEREDVGPKKEKKHTLDSDEEEDNDEDLDGGKNYDVLKEEDIDGQEEQTLDFEGETKITPFNMKEEMEDGHFDGDGFYHFKKDTEIKDAWLDDIDWIKVKHREGDEKKYGSDIESDPESDLGDTFTHKATDKILKIYDDIFSHLKEGESVAKALKRLGGNRKMSSAQRWKLKKAGSLGSADGDGNMADFMKLTDLANKLIEAGNMDVYQETYEMINLKLQRSKAPAPAPALDMFAEEEQQKDTSKSKEKADQEKADQEKADQDVSDCVAQVSWELRWEDKQDAEIHGPFTNEKMLQWQEIGYFAKVHLGYCWKDHLVDKILSYSLITHNRCSPIRPEDNVPLRHRHYQLQTLLTTAIQSSTKF
ncbi:hypothetical protein Pmani_020684 [Petrolisthes manimaculis]|uniref:GYF domain-containing protein n=1 Tax=Petrolisthes manimaculis TaxID=1843537 RepID=A0AAE1PI58_9EUCA|nr:hypothetical protein Pmani_020684 [Petrolisthes manimaculis]